MPYQSLVVLLTSHLGPHISVTCSLCVSICSFTLGVAACAVALPVLAVETAVTHILCLLTQSCVTCTFKICSLVMPDRWSSRLTA